MQYNNGRQQTGNNKIVRKRRRIEILTPNKLFSKLPVLFAQMKAGNN